MSAVSRETGPTEHTREEIYFRTLAHGTMEAQNSQSGICMLEVVVDFHGESEGLKTELS